MAVSVAGVTSRTESTARAFLSSRHFPPPYLQLGELIARSDLIVETAGGPVVPELARATFGAGKDLMVISVGALLDHPDIIDQSRSTGCRLFVPSGAIAGLDGIKSACQGRVDRVIMTSRKPPEALEGAPFLTERGISLVGLDQEKELFSGTAREACRGFPANLNPTLCKVVWPVEIPSASSKFVRSISQITKLPSMLSEPSAPLRVGPLVS